MIEGTLIKHNRLYFFEFRPLKLLKDNEFIFKIYFPEYPKSIFMKLENRNLHYEGFHMIG